MRYLLHFTLCLVSIATTWFFLSSSNTGVFSVYYSGGVSSNGIGDRTGGPLSGGNTCGSCHSGGSYNPSITVSVKNSGGVEVTKYLPGESYKVEFRVSASNGTPNSFGFQGVALTSSNAQAGNFTSAISTNSKIVDFNGRRYAEHSSRSVSGIFSYNWIAPATGTGSVNFYSIGNAVNGSGSGGDQVTATNVKTITEQTITTINYNANYCNNDSDPIPSVSGNQGGSFSSTPFGLSMNSSTGKIDLSASTTGINYKITYTHAEGSTDDFVKINPRYEIQNSETICEGDSILIGGFYRKTAGSYITNLNSIDGCDSVINTALVVNPSYTINETFKICDGDSVEIFGVYRNSPGTFYQNNLTQKGCDSNYIAVLTKAPTYNATFFKSFCAGDSLLHDGNYYKMDTILIDSSLTSSGCDSVTSVSIEKLIVSNEVMVNSNLLTAQQDDASYQWFDCQTNQPLANEINQTFSPTKNGEYFVRISKDNCEIDSECITVNTLDLNDLESEQITIFPNPSKGIFKLQVRKPEEIRKLVLLTELGQKIEDVTMDAISNTIQINVGAGIFFLKIETESETRTMKLIVIQ